MDIKSLNPTMVLKPVNNFFKRFHTIIFFVAVSIGLIVALLMIVSILNISVSTADNASDKADATFDEQTIQKIDKLGNKPTPSKPGARNSPFVEP